VLVSLNRPRRSKIKAKKQSSRILRRAIDPRLLSERERTIVMPFQDFREFLEALRQRGELIDVDRPVALELEVAKAMRKSAAISGPAVVFKSNGTSFPLVGGVYNSRAKAACPAGRNIISPNWTTVPRANPKLRSNHKLAYNYCTF
jgi:hypothetical protein